MGHNKKRFQKKRSNDSVAPIHVLIPILGILAVAASVFIVRNYSTDFKSFAQTSVANTIAMLGSQKVVLTCSGRQISLSRQSVTQITAHCLPIFTPTPTKVSTVTPTPHEGHQVTPTTGSGANETSGKNSMAMSAWAKQKQNFSGECSTQVHDTYSVIGPDGKRYPTWHPPVDPKTGCTFGHEHGRNPSQYQYWDEIRRHFAFDADNNGSISNEELVSAGIPFGYVNEQLDIYSTSMMRHEDHVGHKIDYANGEGDIGDGTDPFDTNKTGGVVVPVKNISGGAKWNQSGIRCYHFHKIHQGVSSPDALTNNLHENIMHEKCTSTRSEFPASTSIVAAMVPFGAPGEFIRFCGADRTTPIVLGTTDANKNYPGTRGQGMRNIGTRDCVEQTMLVPSGQFSSFPYEIWDGNITIRRSDGSLIARNGGSWEVLDAIRYYNPNTTNRISYSVEACYENINGRTARGGDCGFLKDTYGTNNKIAWNDPRSTFRGIHRGQYVLPHELNNQGGSQYWYSDPMGGNAKTTPFAGSIRQFVSTVNTRIAFDSDPRIVLRWHDNGNNTVHAPN